MSPKWPWSELGLEGRCTEREVKRAYAARLKQIDRNDPDAFGSLRRAFTAAKGRALKNNPKGARPAMKDIAAGRTEIVPPDLEAVPDLDLPDLDVPVADAPPPESPEPELPPVVLQEPETAPTPPESKPEPKPEPVKTRIPPVEIKPKPAANPWGTPLKDLDAAFDVDPTQAARTFNDEVQDAITFWPWDVSKLHRLLALDMAQDMGRRRDVEHRLFMDLTKRVTHPEKGYPPKIAELIEEHFGWSTDGVGAQRRLGWHQGFQLILYAHSLSRPKSAARAGFAPAAKPKEDYLWHKGGVFGLVWLISVSGQRMGGWEDYLIQALALLIMFFFIRWIVTLALALISAAARSLRLAGPAVTLARWAFPATLSQLERSAPFRSFGTFCVTGLVLVAMFISTHFTEATPKAPSVGFPNLEFQKMTPEEVREFGRKLEQQRQILETMGIGEVPKSD